MIIQVIFAIIAVLATSVVLNASKKLIIYIGLIGGIGWATYLICLPLYNLYIATYLSSVVIALISHISARYFKAPVTVFFIPSYYTLVPGALMYQSVYSYINGTMNLGSKYMFDTLMIAGMIALKIFTVDTLFMVISTKKNNQIEK